MKDIKQEVKEEVPKDADIEVKQESNEATEDPEKELVAMNHSLGKAAFN